MRHENISVDPFSLHIVLGNQGLLLAFLPTRIYRSYRRERKVGSLSVISAESTRTPLLSLILLFPFVRIRHDHYRKFGKFIKIEEGKLTFPCSQHLEITVLTF